MKPWKNKLVSGALAAAFACASAGCATQLEMNPTRETFLAHLRPGDAAEVVLKTGERKKCVVAQVREEGIQAGYDGTVIRYEDMAAVRVPTTGFKRRVNDAAVVVAVVVVCVAAVPALLMGADLLHRAGWGRRCR